jgi:hypothetical protein
MINYYSVMFLSQHLSDLSGSRLRGDNMEAMGEELAGAQHENERASAHSAREQDQHELPVAQGAFFFWVRWKMIRINAAVASTVLRSSSTVLQKMKGSL